MELLIVLLLLTVCGLLAYISFQLKYMSDFSFGNWRHLADIAERDWKRECERQPPTQESEARES